MSQLAQMLNRWARIPVTADKYASTRETKERLEKKQNKSGEAV